MARVIQPVSGPLRKLLARSKKCKSPDQRGGEFNLNHIHPHQRQLLSSTLCFFHPVALSHEVLSLDDDVKNDIIGVG